MSYSVSPTTTFANINWDSFENRPSIDPSMPFCTKKIGTKMLSAA